MSSHPVLRVLIIGGYGTFGGRLAQALQDCDGLSIIVAGRSWSKAQAFCQTLSMEHAQYHAVAFDREHNVACQIQQLNPQLVVDAAEPFQDYGTAAYSVVEACIQQKRHYLDLADGSDFVEHIAQFDAAAQAQSLFVLSGVSSFPVLSSAAVTYLCQYHSIQNSFVPEHVVAGIAPAGYIPLNLLPFSLVDVPDLREMHKIWPQLKSVWMGAGVAPRLYHGGFNILAWLVRLKLLPSLKPFAKFMYWVMNRYNWGEHRGGLIVQVNGYVVQHAADASIVCQQQQQRSLHLIAEQDDGLGIPSLAAEIIIRKCLAGEYPQHGARVALNAVRFEDYLQRFRLTNKAIYTGVRITPLDAQHQTLPIYRQVLADTFERLAPSVQALHDWRPDESHKAYAGQANIIRGSHPLVPLIATLFGFPKASLGIEVRLEFNRQAEHEHWQRRFAKQHMPSVQFVGQGQYQALLVERIGMAQFAMALEVRQGQLHLHIRHWSLLGIPMPHWLKPRIHAFEFADDAGRFNFHVHIALPWIGLVVRYTGWLVALTKC